jgi:hypothetical protein
MRKNKIKSKVKVPAKSLPPKDITYEDLFLMLNKERPIKFDKYHLLNNIHQKYQLIGKEEIALIIKTLFEIIRERAIQGYKINVNYIFNEFHLIINKSASGHPFLLAKNRTFPKVRKNVHSD